MLRSLFLITLIVARVVSAIGDTLWESDGPQYEDVIQVKDYDCWFCAASISVTAVSQNWVENLYYFPTTPPTSMIPVDSPASQTAIVTIFNPLTLKPVNYTVTVANESTTEDTPGGVWWHSALMQALFLLANDVVDANGDSLIDGVYANATFIPYQGDAYVGLTLLTGFNSTFTLQSDMTGGEDELFSLLLPAPATPITFSTNSQVSVTVPPIEPDHAYGVLNATEYDNGTRVIWVRNPWGATDCFQLADVYNNIYAVENLQGYPSLTWQGQGWV